MEILFIILLGLICGLIVFKKEISRFAGKIKLIPPRRQRIRR